MRVAAVLQKIMEFYEPIYKIHDAWPIESALPTCIVIHHAAALGTTHALC